MIWGRKEKMFSFKVNKTRKISQITNLDKPSKFKVQPRA